MVLEEFGTSSKALGSGFARCARMGWIGKWGFHILEFPVDMHCNHALIIRLYGILSTRNSEMRLLTFCNFTCPGMLDSV